MAERKGLAIAALVLGISGLFSAGGLVIGSVLGIVLAGLALVDRARGGRDVAWAALAANVLALFTLLPLAGGVWAYSQAPAAFAGDDDSLPDPVGWAGHGSAGLEFPLPPPPPPAPPPLRPDAPPAVAETPAPRPAAKPPRLPAEAPLHVGSGIAEPRRTRSVNPVYPPAAIAARIQGVVVLECTISAKGKVVAVRTMRSVPALDQAAIDAVKQWEYTPTLLNGVAVPVIMTVTVNFKLS
jgi:TonB family protein